MGVAAMCIDFLQSLMLYYDLAISWLSQAHHIRSRREIGEYERKKYQHYTLQIANIDQHMTAISNYFGLALQKRSQGLHPPSTNLALSFEYRTLRVAVAETRFVETKDNRRLEDAVMDVDDMITAPSVLSFVMEGTHVTVDWLHYIDTMEID
ncbi:hypothetical protein VNI00_018888 [Paramarasmius palmivorus]|uniref:Uncharacterized protein n=1 Tax=Paramarasmius palmivorus TaxID=297713 RepID=A0AAW0ATL6_9AGAR